MIISVKIVGLSDRVSGKKKSNGQPFDFQVAAYEFTDQFGNKQVACCSIPGKIIDELWPLVGSSYHASVNKVGYTYYIDLISPNPDA